MIRRSISLLSAAIALPIMVHAQGGVLHFDGNIPVHRQGVHLDLAWAGGLNFVQTGSVDLNGDGLKDLFLFDRSGNKVITLLNTGGTGTGVYTVTRDYDHIPPFNTLHDWALIKDYDCDGKEDIFTYSQAGFSVFRNISSGSTPAFEMVKFRVNSNYVTSSGNPVIANLFVSQVDLPGLADVDGDGDLDVLTFSLLGSYVEYHKNLSMETYGHCDSLIFEVRNKCWGSFSESASDNSVTLGVPCSFNVPVPEFPMEPGVPLLLEPDDDRAHAGSTVLPLDLNGNGVMDLLLGDIAFNNVVALYNGGTTSLALMTQTDTQFPSYDVPVNMPIFPGSFHVDVDNDGLKDLIVSPNAASLSQNHESMLFYKNTGLHGAPIFTFQMNDLFQNRMLEFGEGAYPVFFDHDGDGLMDIIVSNHGYWQTDGSYRGSLALLRNVGTVIEPAFELVTDDYMSLSTSGIGQSMYPAFGDVDGDGDMDMYIGDLQGRLHFFRNVSATNEAQFVLQTPNVTDAAGAVMDVGQFAAPQLFDLNGDGLLDLIVGERNGNLNYYRNVGTSASPSWDLVSEDLGGVSTVEWWNITGHSTPFMFKNGQGQKEILLGSESGWIYHYGDIDNNIMGTWTLLDSTYLDIYEGNRTALGLYDLTGDGALDMVIGNYRGGLSFWRSDEVISTNDNDHHSPSNWPRLYPNPSNSTVELVLNGEAGLGETWTMTNSMGQEVMRLRPVTERTAFSVEHLPAGIYLVSMSGAPGTAQRLMVTH